MPATVMSYRQENPELPTLDLPWETKSGWIFFLGFRKLFPASEWLIRRNSSSPLLCPACFYNYSGTDYMLTPIFENLLPKVSLMHL